MKEITADSLLMQMRAMSARAQGAALRETIAAPVAGAEFSTLLRTAVERVNDTQQAASRLATAFETGAANVDLADVMIAMQKASLSFQAASQVRNRLVSAYQEIMSMPI